MFKPVLFSLALATTGFASSASAASLTVLIVDGGFYPEVTYLAPGDTVVFKNDAEAAITTEAADQSWSTGSLLQDASYTLPITAETVLEFSVAGTPEKAGSFSFDFAPLTDVPLIDGIGGESTITN